MTEIEWWGGLLLLWFGFCFWIGRGAYLGERGWSLSKWTFNLSFMFSALVLVFWFYPLGSMLAKQLYLALLVAAVACCVASFLVQSPEDPEQVAGEDDDGFLLNLIGQFVVYFPFLVSLVLGFRKSMEIVNTLGWLS